MEIPREAIPWLLGVFGAFVGSFLNVCIHRLPSHRSVVFPGSACPACGARIRPWQNVPILSWIALRGRCASCRAPISLRYPFVEALTSLLFVAAGLRFGPGWALAHALVFLPMLLVLFFTDLDERVLPDLVTLPGAVVGVLLAFVRESWWPFRSRAELSAALAAGAIALATAVGGAFSLWLIGRLWRFVRPDKPAMGAGDVKMMALLGAFLGPRLALLTLFLGSVLGTAIFVFTRILLLVLPAPGPRSPAPLRALQRRLEESGFLIEGRGAGLGDQIPFGSMLALGAAIALFWGERVIAVYLQVSFWLGDRLFAAVQGIFGGDG